MTDNAVEQAGLQSETALLATSIKKKKECSSENQSQGFRRGLNMLRFSYFGSQMLELRSDVTAKSSVFKQ